MDNAELSEYVVKLSEAVRSTLFLDETVSSELYTSPRVDSHDIGTTYAAAAMYNFLSPTLLSMEIPQWFRTGRPISELLQGFNTEALEVKEHADRGASDNGIITDTNEIAKKPKLYSSDPSYLNSQSVVSDEKLLDDIWQLFSDDNDDPDLRWPAVIK